MTRCLLVSILVAAAAGCSSDSPCESSVGTPPPADARFATPESLGTDGCEPGSLADFDATGFWYAEQETAPLFSGIGPVRIDAQCGGELGLRLSTIAASTTPDYAELDADHLFWRRQLTFNQGDLVYIHAANGCRVNPDGSLFGHTVTCYITPDGEDCRPDTFVMSPFGRIPGESDAEGLELISRHDGDPSTPWPPDMFTANVRVSDGVAFVVRDHDGLRTVDVSDPAAPHDLGYLPVADGERLNDVKIATGPNGETYALLASSTRGIVVVDASDPAAPQVVTTFSPTGEPNHGVHTLFTETLDGQTRAYLADGFSGALGIFDVTDPANPVRLSTDQTTLPDPDIGIHDLYVENGRVYANATTAGLVLIDTLADPANPTIVSTTPSDPGYSHSNWVTEAGGRKISVTGDEGYGAHVQIVDVDEASPELGQVIGEYKLRAPVSAHNIMAFGDRVYMAHYQDGIRVLDVSDPTHPVEVGHLNTWNPDTAPGAKFEGAAGIDVDLDAGLIYVADTPGGLLIARILE